MNKNENEYEYKSEASVINLKRAVIPTDKPNGVIIRGPAGEAILVDYDDDGKMSDSGTEVTIGKWLPTIGKTIPEDMAILVHSVKGSGNMLLKSLEVNRLLRHGNPLKIKDAAREGILPQFVETILEKYMKSLKEKQCGNTVENTDG